MTRNPVEADAFSSTLIKSAARPILITSVLASSVAALARPVDALCSQA